MANSLAHSKWVCKYHVVFIPKYRRKIDYWGMREDIRDIIRDLCKWKGVTIIEGKVMLDHIHLLLLIPPKYSVSSFMGYLKGYANLKYKYGNRHIWATGYYVSTVGLQEKALRKYIQEQEKQDQIEDKISTKEYKNPFKGQAR